MDRGLHPDAPFDQVMVDLDPAGDEQIILVRTPSGLRAWRNRCPHLGLGLDYGDGRCLFDGELVCAMHGARFRSADGVCVDGPCRGEALEAVAVEVGDGQIRLAR